jgi:hypothetical protein
MKFHIDVETAAQEIVLGNAARFGIALELAIMAKRAGGLTAEQLDALRQKLTRDLMDYTDKENATQLIHEAMMRYGKDKRGRYVPSDKYFPEA